MIASSMLSDEQLERYRRMTPDERLCDTADARSVRAHGAAEAAR